MSEVLQLVIQGKDKASTVIGNITSSLPSLKTAAIATAGGITAVSAALFAMTKKTAETFDSVQKFSDQIGVSTEFLSKMRVAAEFSGVAVTTLDKSTQMLQVRIGEAARGIGEGKDAFNALGISIKDANGNLKTSEQIMPELAQAFHNVTNATERAELASKIFGQRGMSMLQIFKDGKEGLDAMTDEAERFGLVVSSKAGVNAAAFNDALSRVKMSMTGLRNVIAEGIMPTITGLSNRMAGFVADNRDKIIAFGKQFLITMAEVAEKGAYAVAGLIDSWRGLQMIWQVIKIAFSEFTTALWEGINAITEKLISFMEKFNFKGIFDDAIAGAQSFVANNQQAIDAMIELSGKSQETLMELANSDMAIQSVENITTKIRESIATITEEGDAYRQAEIEKQNAYNTTLQEIQTTQDELMREKKQEQNDALNEMWNEYMLTDLERLNLWYAEEQKKFEGNQKALVKLAQIYAAKKKKIDDTLLKQEQTNDNLRVSNKNAMYGMLQTAAGEHGSSQMAMMKVQAISETIMQTNKAAAGAYAALAWIPLIGPALGTAAAWAAYAYGIYRVNEIRKQKTSVAHGGMSYVPKESTYFLDQGERVLSPAQNKDLTEFMQGGGGSVVVENLNIHVLENATRADAMLKMDKEDWALVLTEKVVPGLSVLAKRGIRVAAT